MNANEHSLAEWLDAPGTDPEGHLDPEVLEAVYALRPDLAPAARVTAEDILASVQEGPLASPAEAVPPSLASDAPGPIPTPANRSLAAWGGWGGVGLALAAAATFALVGLPTLRGDSPAMNPSPVELEEAPAAASPAASQADEPDEEQAQPQAEPPPPNASKPRPTQRARPARPAAAPAVAPVPSANEPYDMAEGAPVRSRDLIPELAEEDAADGVAEVDSPPTDAVEAEEARRLDNLRADALGALGPAPSWRSGLPPAEVARFEALFADAATKSPREAGDLVATAIQEPPAVAHHAASLAVDYYLAAGDGRAAANTALRGLDYKTANAGWSRLAIRYADLIRGSDPEGAARWYEDATSPSPR